MNGLVPVVNFPEASDDTVFPIEFARSTGSFVHSEYRGDVGCSRKCAGILSALPCWFHSATLFKMIEIDEVCIQTVSLQAVNGQKKRHKTVNKDVLIATNDMLIAGKVAVGTTFEIQVLFCDDKG